MLMTKKKKEILTKLRTCLKRWQKEQEKKNPDQENCKVHMQMSDYYFYKLAESEGITNNHNETSWDRANDFKMAIGTEKYKAYRDLEIVLYRWRKYTLEIGNECAYTDSIIREAQKFLDILTKIPGD